MAKLHARLIRVSKQSWVRELRLALTNHISFSAEHIFEGQLIGDFLTHWLTQGKVKNQSPPLTNAKQIHDCIWTEEYILNYYVWEDKYVSNDVNFFTYLLAELGSETNRIKGNVSSMPAFKGIDVLVADQI